MPNQWPSLLGISHRSRWADNKGSAEAVSNWIYQTNSTPTVAVKHCTCEKEECVDTMLRQV